MLLFYPLAKALELTQSGVWIFFFLAAAAVLLDRRAHVAGGLALAVGISIKPHLVLVPIGLALVGRFPRKPLVACFAGLAVTGIACLVYAGFANLRDYAFELLPHLSSGYAYYPNQSFNGMFLRLFTDQDPAVYNLSVKVPWIQKAAMASGLSLVGLAVLAGRGRARAGETEGDLLCFGAVLAAAVLASPLCWIHHYALLAIPIAIGARELHRIPSLRRGGLDLLFLASAVLLSFFFDTRRAPALLSGPEFTGALVFLACTFTLMRRRVA